MPVAAATTRGTAYHPLCLVQGTGFWPGREPRRARVQRGIFQFYLSNNGQEFENCVL